MASATNRTKPPAVPPSHTGVVEDQGQLADPADRDPAVDRTGPGDDPAKAEDRGSQQGLGSAPRRGRHAVRRCGFGVPAARSRLRGIRPGRRRCPPVVRGLASTAVAAQNANRPIGQELTESGRVDPATWQGGRVYGNVDRIETPEVGPTAGTAELDEEFERLLADEQRIEPRDWMPEGYRRR